MSVDINISNYESYLLSFIDKELNGEELAALELFLQKHPQIRQELELLESTCLMPDEQIVFDNKAALYKSTAFRLSAADETRLLDYIDGELHTAAELELQEYLRQHPAAQKELALFQAAKLQPDTSVVFEHKAGLYRHEQRKPAAVYRLIGWGATAAAIIAGLIIWLQPAGRQTHQEPLVADNVIPVKRAPQAIPVTPAPFTPSAPAPADARIATKNTKTIITHAPAKKTTVPAAPDETPVVATNKVTQTDIPVIAQLPPPRNTTEELVEKRLETVGNRQVAAIGSTPENNREPVLAAANTSSSTTVTAAPAPAPVRGELIASVSGSDSKILDKVTNVAKFFSRKRNK
ncbi:anti-sigma factor family protein [Chitinophaga nivalis]|uniref:Uncharacterized protein n=1 Tax=Chitinophaga nivalis TaxID=2991709 RepID=A0ABT3IVR3_9BACT|nr:hypothetical protein [Chitinophaga nivalis]MCW3462238.1 hypothetical protein [Chitinophaga nivalis]MCW3488070.1 hypothetical protein [Chitinophaga nivalis]